MRNEIKIFILIFIFGLISSLFIISTSSNIIFKNSNFEKKVTFEGSDIPGDNGYLVINRNDITPAVADYVTFENKKNHIFFSNGDNKIKETLYFNIPDLEEGTYYVDIKAVFSSGKKERKTIIFSVI